MNLQQQHLASTTSSNIPLNSNATQIAALINNNAGTANKPIKQQESILQQPQQPQLSDKKTTSNSSGVWGKLFGVKSSIAAETTANNSYNNKCNSKANNNHYYNYNSNNYFSN